MAAGAAWAARVGEAQIKTISFYRDYRDYTGGHRKFRDYVDHTVAYPACQALLWQRSSAAVAPALFQDIVGVTYQDDYRPDLADVAFLAGMDWEAYLPFLDESQPRINFIQHVRHGDPAHPLHAFLRFRAIRLCVSDAVREAIAPHANGPCLTIRMGHDIPAVPAAKVREVYVQAVKQPALGEAVSRRLQAQGLRVLLHATPVEATEVLDAMAGSHVTLALPNPTEGFYLPGIEAMALSDWAVVPDCVASREYTRAGANISSCALEEDACIIAVSDALRRTRSPLQALHRWRGRRIARGYSLAAEREAFHRVLGKLDTLW